MTDADTTNFSYATNKATEISILKNISIDRSMITQVGRAGRVSATSNRVNSIINTGFDGATLKFTTYLKPVTDGGNVISAEKLLWESLSATNTADTAINSTIAFTSGNTNKLRELYFYLIFEDGTYYKVSRGVVASVEIDLDIQGIALANWTILALDASYSKTANLTGTPKVLTDKVYIRNRLSTLSLTLNAVPYQLAIVEANLTINNNPTLINRQRVGELFDPSGHYTGSRTVESKLKFYLDTKTDGNSDFWNNAFNISEFIFATSKIAYILVVSAFRQNRVACCPKICTPGKHSNCNA